MSGPQHLPRPRVHADPGTRPGDGAGAPPRSDDRDRGVALTLVLAMMVITGLIVIPTMTYATTVMRANTALSEKTQRVEGVKAGLRVALADPVRLYESCGAGGPTTPVSLASMSANGVSVSTRCYFIDYQAAQSAEELRLGLVSTQAGTTPPEALSGNSFVPVDPASIDEWLTQTTVLSETDKIWLPNLPVHGLNLRSPNGTQMPSGYPECRVFFPGTYTDQVVLDGPTYFTSGIYYFEDEVRIEGGASVVVGLGATPGCTIDQEAVFYAENVPSTHNISGLGGTWVLGDRGRIVVDNSNGGEISLQFNQRYVNPDDPGDVPSQGVSIISVNGELATDGVTGQDLLAPDIIHVPLSAVGADGTTTAIAQEYLPSVLTPKPSVPDAPAAPTAQRFDSAALVSWTAPFDGGSPITGYTVTASTGATCTTLGATSCAVTGLPNGTPVTFVATATNDVGDSELSEPSDPVTPGGSTSLNVPAAPNAPTAVPYEGVVRVSWSAPSDGGSPITGYTVTASPDGASCSVDMTTTTPPELECDVTGLDPLLLPGYQFTVQATNAVGTSAPSAFNPTPVVPALGLGTPPEPPAPPEPAFFAPTPVVELSLPETAATNVRIPGYVAVPQGRFFVDNPNGHPVVVAGGVLAAQFDVTDARASGPNSVDIGFLETVVQRKFRIVSSTDAGRETSTAVVQVNQNGAYAINSWEVQ